MDFCNFCMIVSSFFSIQTELLIQAQLTRESATLPPSLQGDFRRVLELAPRLLEELMKVITISSVTLFEIYKTTANCIFL